MVNVRGSLIVAPFGGISKRMSTSPISAGIPVTGQEPIILDMATSTVAEGKALVALKGGKPLPGDAIIDGDGQLTADPVPLYGESATSINPVAGGGEGALGRFGPLGRLDMGGFNGLVVRSDADGDDVFGI